MRIDCRQVLMPLVTFRPLRRAPGTFGRFGADRSGSTLVETALVLLIIVPLFIGVAELSEALTLQRRVETAAATAADLVTRSTEGGAAFGAQIEELKAIPGVLKKIVQAGPDTGPEVGFRLVIFDIVDENKKKVSKQVGIYACGKGMSGALTAKDEVPSEVLKSSQGLTRLVRVETQVGFESSFKYFLNTVTLRGESYFAPRLGNDIKLPSSGGGC